MTIQHDSLDPRRLRIAAMTEVPADRPHAHMINVIKTAGGFARNGHDVVLFCRDPESGESTDSIASRYAEPSLLWRTPARRMGLPADVTHIDDFARWAAESAAELTPHLVYARSFRCALAAAELGLTVICETHAHVGDPNPLLSETINATKRERAGIAGIVTISSVLAEHYVRRGADPHRVHVVPDGVDAALFTPPTDASQRGPSPFPRVQNPVHAIKNVLYSGHLYDYKGVPTLIEAAALLGQRTHVHLLGGLHEDVARVQAFVHARGVTNVTTHGPVSHVDVPRWLWHSDALVLPPSARHPSARWTSPLKLGEYLASGTALVASDIPALRDWVDDRVVEWFRPDDPLDLVRAIEQALAESPRRAAARRIDAAELAESFSYRRRSQRILTAAGLGSRDAESIHRSTASQAVART